MCCSLHPAIALPSLTDDKGSHAFAGAATGTVCKAACARLNPQALGTDAVPAAYLANRPRGSARKRILRQRNWRVAGTGLALIGLAAAFFCGMAMLGASPRVNDPVALMRTVLTVSGAAAAIGLAMFVFGTIGRKTP
jgi:hypothetical protein